MLIPIKVRDSHIREDGYFIRFACISGGQYRFFIRFFKSWSPDKKSDSDAVLYMRKRKNSNPPEYE